jgi:alpha-beta hydrolase superfamily lysophospholipase
MMLHGFTSFADSLATIAKHAVKHSVEAVAMDLRGFGRSRGTDQGNFDSVDVLVSDVVTYFKKIRKRYPNLPIFCMGISLGGHITLRLSQELGPALRGIIIAVPLVFPKTKLAKNWFTKHLFLTVGRFFGWLHAPVPDFNDSYRIHEAHTYTMNHPLQHVGPIYLSTVLALLRSCVTMQNHIEDFEVPMLIIRVGVDPLVCNQAIEDLYERTRSKDKMLIDYPNAWHSIQKDPDVYNVIKRVMGWIDARL